MSESDLYAETFLYLAFLGPSEEEKRNKENFYSDNIIDIKADPYYVILTHRIKVSSMR